MAEVTLTGAVRKAIRNEGWADNVRLRLVLPFVVGDVGYPRGSGPPPKTDDDGALNGSDGVVLIVPDSGAAKYEITFPDDDRTTREIALSAADATPDLSDAIVGGTAPTGGEIVVSGSLHDVFGDTGWNGVVDVALTALFATTDGVFPPMTERIKVDNDGNFNGTDGLLLYVPTGEASRWTFTFYESDAANAGISAVVTAVLESSMTTVLIGDLLAGYYGVSYVSFGDEEGDTLTDELGNVLIGSF